MTKAESTMAWCEPCGLHTRHRVSETELICLVCLEIRVRIKHKGLDVWPSPEPFGTAEILQENCRRAADRIRELEHNQEALLSLLRHAVCQIPDPSERFADLMYRFDTMSVSEALAEKAWR